MKLPCLFLSAILLAPFAAADDWPAWHGPNRDAICRETGLLQDWPKSGPKLLWKIKTLGEGYSGPAIVGNVLYTMGNREGKEWVLALDVGKEGKEIWASPIGPVRHDGGSYAGPRSTPTIDGDRLYTLGINGDLVCMSTKDGKIIWRHDLVKEFGGKIPGWGYSESVLVDGPLVICTPGQDKATMLAVNKTDGSVVWQAKVLWQPNLWEGAAYSSPVKFAAGGVEQYVTLAQRGVIAVRASDGKFCWRWDHPANHVASIPTCVPSRQTIFAASGYGAGGGLVEIQQTADGYKAKELYFVKHMQNWHGGVILLDGYLYGSDDNQLTCLDHKTGGMKWSDRTCTKPSLLYADGRLYCRDEWGPISLVEAASKGFKLHGRFDQPDRSRKYAWPHLVIAGGRMYVRDQELLLCYEVKKSRPGNTRPEK
jgi:outer membrane protein assembly factor BamB